MALGPRDGDHCLKHLRGEMAKEGRRREDRTKGKGEKEEEIKRKRNLASIPMRKWHSLVNIAPNGPDTDFLVIN
jgi:hypothetical protein